ncbi:DNA-binding protein [Nocardia salmonicida]|uniref:DNA-binding protein n=1 Tax=Nocardia salmonicida TaxID=53431 RepID=UPI0033DDB7B2
MEHDQASPGELLEPSKTAEMMHTTPGKLAQDRYLGRGLPYIKYGRKVLYRVADIRAYLDENVHGQVRMS